MVRTAAAIDPDGKDALDRSLIANDGEILSRLRLSAAEAARVCDVTPRQLIYWTRKGLLRPTGVSGDHDYDALAMEKAIRIRQALAQGHSLEKAAQQVERALSAGAADVARLTALDGDALEGELRRRLERLEARLVQLRQAIPPALTVARLRRAVGLLGRLEAAGIFAAGVTGESAKAITLRLGGAVEELESAIADAGATGL